MKSLPNASLMVRHKKALKPLGSIFIFRLRNYLKPLKGDSSLRPLNGGTVRCFKRFSLQLSQPQNGSVPNKIA